MEFTDQANGESLRGPPRSCDRGTRSRRLIGFIIGKGGANIDQIQRASSAKLSTKDENGPRSFQREWVYIQIEGSGIAVSSSRVDRAFTISMNDGRAQMFAPFY